MINQITSSSKAIYLFAHGAGAGMDHTFMETMASLLLNEGIGVVRFNFPYMEAGRKAPGSPKDAINRIAMVFDEISEKYNLPVFIGGKSYGGRMSSTAVAEGSISNIKGLVFFGFPLHPPGNPSDKRAEHLYEVNLPMLFLQGTNDKLAEIELIKKVASNHSSAFLKEYEHADHSFKVPKKSGIVQEDVYKQLAKDAAAWMKVN